VWSSDERQARPPTTRRAHQARIHLFLGRQDREPRAVPELDHVARLHGLHLAPGQRRTVEPGPVGRAQVTDAPATVELDELRVLPRDVGVPTDRVLQAWSIRAADE